MRFQTIDQWLAWQCSLHFKTIDLGLERVGQVAAKLQIDRIATRIVTVAGTNGKGSTVACYENWLHRAGYSVASYTSPHLLSYNERIKFNLEMVSDAQLCEAFEAIDQSRQNVALTYFEFGTLAALWLIGRYQPDYAILEVGLGGRLDAVNLVDADLVHLTSIGIDHQSWLGDDREKIGFEKAGVLRPGIPVVCNDPDLPLSVAAEIERLGCRKLQYQHDFFMLETQKPGKYLWQGCDHEYLVTPVLPGIHQVQNQAGVIAGLSLLLSDDKIDAESMVSNFQGTTLAGRFQKLKTRLTAQVYIDVGHNPDAAAALAENLKRIKPDDGKIVVLLGMLEDKDCRSFAEALKDCVDAWWLLTLEGERGLEARCLGERISGVVCVEKQFARVDQVLEHALSSLTNQDIMLVTGSFVTVELMLRATSDTDAE